MPKKGQPSSRTYGIKLLGSKSDEAKTEFPVTSKKFDVVYYDLTGKIRYIDEEGKTMPTVDQKANAKKLREEITTLEQFEAIGSYADVARKYHVGFSSAHGLLRSLRAKKAKEEKELDVKVNQEAVEQNHEDKSVRYPLEFELNKATDSLSSEQNAGQIEPGDTPATGLP